jgi:hypothetical protein
VNLVIEKSGGGIIRNRFSNFGENMASEIRLRIAKQQLDTPEPIVATKPLSDLRTVSAPFACISLALDDLPTISENTKQSMEDYLRRGGFVWIVAHSPSDSFDVRPIIRNEPFTEHILRRVLPAAVITTENVKYAGFRPVIPPSVIDPAMSEELTQLISKRLQSMDVLSFEGRPVAIVSWTFPAPADKDIYTGRAPTIPRNIPRSSPPRPTSAPPPSRQDQSDVKMFNIKHMATNIYVNILLH